MRVLFICSGNICRSPTAEGVLRHLLAASGSAAVVEIDSAGTEDYHVGRPPDPRTLAAARRRGIDLSGLRARQVEVADFERFDLLLAMDDTHVEYLREIAPAEHRAKVRLFLDYAPDLGRRHVPDPYYGGEQGFEEVLDLVEVAAARLLAELTRR